MPRFLRFLPIVYSLTLLAEAGRVWWMFELLSHWRVHYILLGSACLALFLYAKKYRAASIVLMVLGVHLLRVVPYIVFFPPRYTPEPQTLSLVFANTYWLSESSDKLVASITEQDPDIVLLSEILEPNFKELQVRLPQYTYGEYTGGLYAFNLAYLSKRPVHKNVEYFIPLVPTLDLQTELAGTPIHVIVAHPHSPVDGEFVAHRDTLLSALFAYTAAQTEPTVMGGDLNISPYSPYYQVLRRAYPQLTDSSETFGVQNSWPTHIVPGLLAIPIDQVWTNSGLRVLERKLGPQTGSDHSPLFVRVGL